MKKLVIYPEFPDKIQRNFDYDVSVTMDGRTEQLPVYNHTVESNVSRRPGADMYRRFSMFAFDGGEVRVDIRVKSDFTKYTVFPSAKGFKHSFKDGVISVFLDKPDYFGIQLDDDQNTIISVFADLPEREEDIPSKDDPNVLFIDDWYETENGLFDLDGENKTVYIAPGAVLNARVTITGKNCKMTGRGAIVDPFENLYEYDIQFGGTEGRGRKMLIIQGEDNYAEGLVLMDARCFNMMLGGSRNSVRNMKAMSTMMTTDGITAVGNDVHAYHCWLYVGDNGIVFSSKNSSFYDIAIGTTCAALFPQGSPVGNLFEDINVFRADDGIVTFRYNGTQPGTKEQAADVTLRRLNAMEIPQYATHFFQGGNMGSLPKVFTFEDVSTVMPSTAVQFRNDNNYLYSDNFTLNFKTVNIGGKPIKKVPQISVANALCAENEITAEYNDGFVPVKRDETEIGYTAPSKIYVGAKQVKLAGIPTFDKLPADAFCRAIGKKNILGKELAGPDDLMKAGIISAYEEKDGELHMTASYAGENLILPDEGELSRYAEGACWTLDLVVSKDDEGFIYNILNIKSPSAGMTRQITDELRVYGKGTYRVSFRAKGACDGCLKLSVQADKRSDKYPFDVSDNWKEYEFEFTADDEMLNAARNTISFSGEKDFIPSFALRDLSLVKIG